MTSVASWDFYTGVAATLLVVATVFAPDLSVLEHQEISVPVTQTAITLNHAEIPVGGFLGVLVSACRQDGWCCG